MAQIFQMIISNVFSEKKISEIDQKFPRIKSIGSTSLLVELVDFCHQATSYYPSLG